MIQKETAVITPTARVTAARLAIREARPRRLSSTLLWAAQIPLGVAFVFFGLAKLNGAQVQEFSLIGAGQWMRYLVGAAEDRKSTRLNSSHVEISYAVF